MQGAPCNSIFWALKACVGSAVTGQIHGRKVHAGIEREDGSVLAAAGCSEEVSLCSPACSLPQVFSIKTAIREGVLRHMSPSTTAFLSSPSVHGCRPMPQGPDFLLQDPSTSLGQIWQFSLEALCREVCENEQEKPGVHAYVCMDTDIFILPLPCKKTGLDCGKLRMGVGASSSAGRGLQARWFFPRGVKREVCLRAGWGPKPSSPAWHHFGRLRYTALSLRGGPHPRNPNPCLQLSLPDAACWAESPGAGQKLVERRKPFKITCFL